MESESLKSAQIGCLESESKSNWRTRIEIEFESGQIEIESKSNPSNPYQQLRASRKN